MREAFEQADAPACLQTCERVAPDKLFVSAIPTNAGTVLLVDGEMQGLRRQSERRNERRVRHLPFT